MRRAIGPSRLPRSPAASAMLAVLSATILIPRLFGIALTMKKTLNRRQFLLFPRLALCRSALARALWDQYLRDELIPTLVCPTECGWNHLLDMFQFGRSYLIVRGEQFDDIRFALAFETWEEAQETRDLLLAMGL